MFEEEVQDFIQKWSCGIVVGMSVKVKAQTCKGAAIGVAAQRGKTCHLSS
jgi:hypothetical protein